MRAMTGLDCSLIKSFALCLVTFLLVQDSRADSALEFDGIDDRVLVPYDDSFPIESFTLAAWIKMTPPGHRSAIIAHGEDDNSFNLSWQLYVTSAGTLQIMLENQNEQNFCYPLTFSGEPQSSCGNAQDLFVADDQWHHVAATRELSGRLVLYIDGLSRAECGQTGVPSSNNFQRLSIGCTFGTIGPPPGGVEPPTWFFPGAIDDPAVWNVALSPSDVQQVYGDGVNPTDENLIGYWTFDEASGQTVTDLSAAGNDGFLGTDPSDDDDDPQWITKEDNSGLCDLLLYNGTIMTFDDEGATASAIEITANVITAVWFGDPGDPGCAQSIDLDGRTVIPGLIDNHVHWLDRAYRPGHNVAEMDNAYSWQGAAEILLKKVINVPAVSVDATADNFLTAIGGFTPTQFAEGALPDLATLDGIDRPVFLSAGFSGPSQTNSAGIVYFRARGVTVSDNGTITTSDTAAARDALYAEHDFDDQVRGTLDLMGWSASVGLTTVMNFTEDSAAAETLYVDGTALTRLRHNLGSQSLVQAPNVIQQVVESDGDDMFRHVLLGEFIVSGFTGVPADYEAAATLVAEAGVSHHQHVIPDSDASDFLDVWEAVNDISPVTDLRWQLAHVFNMGATTMDRLDALGGGFAMQTQNYAGTLIRTDEGPPFRSAYDHSTLRVSAGTDGGNLGPINPWLAIYFMTTGLNDKGDVRLPPGETITVTEAIELYTRSASWFSFDEATLGSLEVEKLADIVVLSDDVLALEATGEHAELRNITSVLTIVDGDIVYSDGSLVACVDSNEYGEWYRRTGDGVCVFGTGNGSGDVLDPTPTANVCGFGMIMMLMFTAGTLAFWRIDRLT